MADCFRALLFISSAVIMVINTLILFVPNLISYTVSINTANVLNLTQSVQQMMAANGMTSVNGGQIPGMNPNSMGSAGMAGSGSFGMSQMPQKVVVQEYLGIWRLGVEMKEPYTFSWKDSYAGAADKIEEMVGMMSIDASDPLQAMGVKAVRTYAEIVRTAFVRHEVAAVFGWLASFLAMTLTFAHMFKKSHNTTLEAITLVSHLLQAVLMGVVLAAFAQILAMVSMVLDIFDFMKVTKTYHLIILGFVGVLAAVVLAVVHLLLIVIRRGGEEVKDDVQYRQLVNNTDSDDRII